MDWLSLAGSALGGLGSLFGGLFGKKGQDDANATNLQIARETNQANRDNQEYQNQWNLQMWNEQNRYNTPAEQRKRLEDAGLNPIFYGLDGTGNAGALTSAPFTAVNGAPMSNSGQFLGQGISNAALQAAQIANINAQTKKIDSERENTEMENEILNATKGSVIESSFVQLEFNKANVVKTNAEAREVSKRIEQIDKQMGLIDKQIESLTNEINLSQLRYRLDKWSHEQEIDIKKQNLSLDKLRFEFDKVALAKNLTLAWYNAKTGRMNAETNQQNADTNEYNAETQRKNAETNRYVADVNTMLRCYKFPFELKLMDRQIIGQTLSNARQVVGLQADCKELMESYADDEQDIWFNILRAVGSIVTNLCCSDVEGHEGGTESILSRHAVNVANGSYSID